ncbi:hypothetical protein ACQP2E_06155 [Actinoplanes sp. CA-015351]|uniref:hypothetical protein n=1 Tax=Actinoplanes sp. CA-015351 TaxID=3239897 RepID=UPI003D95EE64
MLMLLAVAFFPFVLAVQLKNLAHSIYRNRLWILRDRITDDLRLGKIEDNPSARHVKELVDRQIHIAGRHTLLDSLLAIQIFDVTGDTSVFEEILPAGTPDVDRPVLTEYLDALQTATTSHLKWGSVFGWLVSGLMAVTYLVTMIKTKRTGNADQSAEPRSTTPSHVATRSNRRDRVHRHTRTPMGQAAQELLHKVERAEVEIMYAAAPARRQTSVTDRAEVLVGR